MADFMCVCHVSASSPGLSDGVRVLLDVAGGGIAIHQSYVIIYKFIEL